MYYFKKIIAYLVILSVLWNDVAFCMGDRDPSDPRNGSNGLTHSLSVTDPADEEDAAPPPPPSAPPRDDGNSGGDGDRVPRSPVSDEAAAPAVELARIAPRLFEASADGAAASSPAAAPLSPSAASGVALLAPPPMSPSESERAAPRASVTSAPTEDASRAAPADDVKVNGALALAPPSAEGNGAGVDDPYFDRKYPFLSQFLGMTGWTQRDLRESPYPINLEALDRLAREELFWGRPRSRKEFFLLWPRWVAIDYKLGNLFSSCCLGRDGIAYTDEERPGVDCSSRVCIRGRSIPVKSERSRKRAVAVDEFRDGTMQAFTDGLHWTLIGLAVLQGATATVVNVADLLFNSNSTSILGAANWLQQNRWGFIAFAVPPLIGIGKGVMSIINSDEPTLAAVVHHETILKGFSEGWWNDYIRPVGWLPPIKRATFPLERLVLWYGSQLPPAAREKAYTLLEDLAKTRKGYPQFAAMRRIARIVHGLDLNNYAHLDKGTLQHLVSIKARSLRTLQELRDDLHKKKGCNYELINAVYADYLLWTLGQSSSIASWITMGILKGADQAYKLLFAVRVLQTVIQYLNCPRLPGFSWGGGPYEWPSTFDDQCFSGYVRVFNRIPPQPLESLEIGKFTFNGAFRLDLSNKGLDGETVIQLLEAFKEKGVPIVSAIFRGNFINKRIYFKRLLELLPDARKIDLGENGIEDYYAGSGLNDTVALGEALRDTPLPFLTHVYLDGNLMGSQEESDPFQGLPSLAEGFKAHKATLIFLKLANNKLGDYGVDGLRTFGNATRELTALTALDISGNNAEILGPEPTEALMDNAPPSLRSLKMATNEMGNRYLGGDSNVRGALAVARNLGRLTALTELDISSNAIPNTSNEGMDAIIEAVPSAPLLRIFKLYPQFPGLNATQVARFNAGLGFTRVPERFAVPLTTEADVEAYFDALSPTTTSVNLTGLIGNPEVVPFIMDRLAQLPFLTGLDVSDCGLDYYFLEGRRGSIPFGTRLGNLTTLRSLAFRRNYIGEGGPEGGIAIGDALRFLRSLTRLDGSHNLLGISGFSAGSRRIGQNLPLSLREVIFTNNWIGAALDETDAMAFAERVEVLSELTDADFSLNYFGLWGPRALSRMFTSFGRVNPSRLTRLNLRRTAMGTTGVNETITLSENLESLSALETLILSFNSIGSKGTGGLERLITTFARLPHAKTIELAGAKNISWGYAANAAAQVSAGELEKACRAALCSLNSEGDSSGGDSSGGDSSGGDDQPQATAFRTQGEREFEAAPFPKTRWSSARWSAPEEGSFEEDDFNFDTRRFEPSYPPRPDDTGGAATLSPLPIFKIFSFVPKLPVPSFRFGSDPLALPSPSQGTSSPPPSSSKEVVLQDAESLETLTPISDPPLLDIGLASAGKSAACTFVPVMVEDVLNRAGTPTLLTYAVTTTAQVGMIVYTTVALAPTAAGMGVNAVSRALGAPSVVSSALGSTTAVAVSLLSGNTITPATLAVSLASGIVGSTVAVKAKNVVSFVIFHPKTVKVAQASWNFSKSAAKVSWGFAKFAWTYVQDTVDLYTG